MPTTMEHQPFSPPDQEGSVIYVLTSPDANWEAALLAIHAHLAGQVASEGVLFEGLVGGSEALTEAARRMPSLRSFRLWAVEAGDGEDFGDPDDWAFETGADPRVVEALMIVEETLGFFPEMRALGTVPRFADAARLRRVVLDGYRHLYMNGDCWFLAAAGHRLAGLPIIGISTPLPEAAEAVRNGQWHLPGDLFGTVDHVALELPDGRWLDIRGIHETRDDLLAYRQPSSDGHLPALAPMTLEDVHAARGLPQDWLAEGKLDPADLRFQAQTDRLFRDLWPDLCEEPAPAFTAAPAPGGTLPSF